MANGLITIFGGSGFIGRHLMRRLTAKGYRIRLASRDPEDATDLMTQGSVGQIVGLKTNVRNQASVERAVRGSDIVINLVGILYESGAQTFGAVHVDAAERIAKASKQAGVRHLIHMSALGADRAHEAGYARSKAVGEELAATEFPGATILRPAVVFGRDDDFFNRFARILALSPVFPLVDGGKMKMQPVWVQDLAEAILRIIETPDQQGKTWEFTGPDIYSLRDLMSKILDATGRKCLLLPVPAGVMSVMAFFMGLIPGRPPLTTDQVKLLKVDNVASGQYPNLADLGITAGRIDAIVPQYLQRYKKGGGYQSALPDQP